MTKLTEHELLVQQITKGASAWTDETSTDVKLAHAKAKARGADCDRCPLKGLQQGPVMSELRPGSEILFVGEAPGAREVEQGRPFIGPSGRELSEALKLVELGREDVSLTNATLCRPPGKLSMRVYLALHKAKHPDAPTPQSCCEPRLRSDIEAADPALIMPLGAVGLKQTASALGIRTGKRKDRKPGERSLLGLQEQRGHPFQVSSDLWVLPSFHPAFGLRKERWILGALRRDIETATLILKHRGYNFEEPDVLIAWCPPIPNDSPWKSEIPEWFKPYEDPVQFADRLDELLVSVQNKKLFLTIDIETEGVKPTAQIRIINLHWVDEGREHVVIVPLRYRDGSTIEPVPGFNQRMFQFTKSIIDKPRIICFQNGTFDTRYLLRDELMKGRRTKWLDTMLGHRSSYWGEAPSRLSSIIADVRHTVKRSIMMELHKDQFLHGGDEKE